MIKRCAGINVPVFSLRSKKGLGTGEFLDLIPLIDWAKESGFKLIQILPVNDTSIYENEKDSSPYSILSTFALHPIYLNIQTIAPELTDEIKPIAKILNLPRLDYRRTYLAKKELLKMLFILQGKKDLNSKAFEKYFKRSQSYLKPYAAFCALRSQFKTSNFRKWGPFSTYSQLIVDEICEKEDVEFFYFTQFHLDKQMKEVVAYAKQQKILLKGDFPMGVHAHSVEAWRFSEYFRWNYAIGAPPDFYNALGQNWGFPSYKWSEIKEEGYFFLKARLQWMEQYFGAVRLDHVLGYFRLWEVPKEEVRGLMGSFFPAYGFSEEEITAKGLLDLKRLTEPFPSPPKGLETQKKAKTKIKDPLKRNELYTCIENRLFFKREKIYHPRINLRETTSFKSLNIEQQNKVLELYKEYFNHRNEVLWAREGREKLKLIKKSTSLILCAEDIGVIPVCVAEILKELKIFNLIVQRIPKDPKILLEDPNSFPETSVCMPSNQDMSTLRGWWEEDEEKTTLYYQKILKCLGTPPKVLDENLAQEIIQAHLDSDSKFAVFLMQDLLAMSDALKHPHPKEERINDPASPHILWNWRCHIYIEELLLAKSFGKKLAEMINKANR